jgi:hypothetical protein
MREKEKHKGTRIVVKALNDRGMKSLAVQKRDELELRKRYKGVPKWRQPARVRNYLKTVSAFIPKDDLPREHHILGFGKLDAVNRNAIKQGISKAMYDNGCRQYDFEVLFYDD